MRADPFAPSWELIGGWDSSYTPDGAWSDSSKTGDDPCPDGYRVPTKRQWDGVQDNNTQSTVGTWSSTAIDYSDYRRYGHSVRCITE